MADNFDLKARQRTYANFARLLQWSLGGILTVILFLWIVVL